MGKTRFEWPGLKACPFCVHGEPMMVVDQVDGLPEGDDVCFVECAGCGAKGPVGLREEQAARCWNRRVEVVDGAA